MKRSRSEVGHAKNVANFTALIQLLGEMGRMYNPSNPSIAISSLEPLRDNLNASIQNLADSIPPFKHAVANRENAFSPLGKLTTRIKNSYNSMGLSKADNDNVLNLVKKIRGDHRAKQAAEIETGETATISNMHLSYTNKANNLQSLISLLASYPAYAPNEPELTTGSLLEMCNKLKDFNKEAANKMFTLITARKQRNDLLYNNPDNLLSLVNPIKDYIKSVQGAEAYYKAAVRLKFKRVTI